MNAGNPVTCDARGTEPREACFTQAVEPTDQGAREGCAWDIEVETAVSLARVLSGGKESVRVPLGEPCAACRGSGTKNAAGDWPCPRCGGLGRLNGECKLVEFTVPQGIEDGTVLRLRGEGLSARQSGGAPGDVLVVVRVFPDPRFFREGTELFRTETIDVADAVFGTELQVPTLDGRIDVTVPPRTQPGAVLHLRGQGLPPFGGGQRGDLDIIVSVRIPGPPGPEEQRLCEQLCSP